MTAAQRATLEAELATCEVAGRSFPLSKANAALADALRAALGTCGTCEHAGERDDKRVWCAPPLRTDADLDTYPHSHKVMPLDGRCNGWMAKEGA